MALESEFQDKINVLKMRQIQYKGQLGQDKTKFNESMNECIKKVLKGDEYKEDPSYIRFKRQNPGATKESWLDSLSTAEKIELIVSKKNALEEAKKK